MHTLQPNSPFIIGSWVLVMHFIGTHPETVAHDVSGRAPRVSCTLFAGSGPEANNFCGFPSRKPEILGIRILWAHDCLLLGPGLLVSGMYRTETFAYHTTYPRAYM